MRKLSELNLQKYRDKVCLLRVDLNVEKEEEKDNFRLEAVLPTIRYLLAHDIRVVLLSHRGRPTGKDFALSLRPFAKGIGKRIREKVEFIPEFNFKNIKQKVGFTNQRTKNHLFLLENLRFLPGEDNNDKRLARQLASIGDFYVNDAFAVSHRSNASIDAITRFIPSYAGLLLEKEVGCLSVAVERQPHPFIIIFGGAKVSDKLDVMKRFSKKADCFLMAGGVANTFFAAEGLPMGKSLVDWNRILFAKQMQKEAKILLPIDTVINHECVLDIGPSTIQRFQAQIVKARAIIWNGPPGYFAIKGCENGTREVWRAILTNKRARTIVGGGETTAALHKYFKNAKIPPNIFISTGGGAMLQFLAGKKLPGIEALK